MKILSIGYLTMRFQTALLLLVAALVLLMAGTLTTAAGLYATERALADRGRLLSGIAGRIAQQLDQALAERWLDVQKLAELSSFQPNQPGQDADRQRRLNALTAAFPEYAWIGFADIDGTVLSASNELLVGANVSARPWFREALRAPFAGDVHEAKLLATLLPSTSGEPLRFVDVAAPVVDTQGVVHGVIGAHLYLQWAQSVLSAVIEPVSDQYQVSVLVLNASGELVLGPADRRGETLKFASANAAMARDFGYLTEPWLDGTDGLTGFATASGFRHFPGLGWHVLVHQPEAVALAPVRSLQWQMALAGITLAALFCGLAILLVRRVTRPLRQLASELSAARGMEDLARLDTDSGFDELRLIKLQLHALADRIIRREAEAEGHQRQISALEITAVTDPLTGVLNRRGLEQRLRRLSDQINRYPRPLTIAALDLDHFKRVNDEAGHAAGDAVLAQFAQRLSNAIRPTDFLARVGGEEFLLILPETRLDEALPLAERLRLEITEAPMSTDAGPRQITTSIGLASIRGDPPLDLQALIRRADQALYTAKQAGRNRVCTEPRPPD